MSLTGRLEDLQRTIPLGISPSAVVFAAGAVWVAGYDSGTVIKVDAAKERILGRAHVGTGTVSLAFADGDLWAANSLDSTVLRIDPMSLMVRAAIPVGSGPGGVIASAGSVWVANQYSGDVSRIDPQRDAVVETVAVGGMPTSLTPDGGRLWVGVAATSGSHRGGTFVVASAAAAASVDPAFYSLAEPTTFGGLAYDTLVTFDHTGGVGGLRLVPDLAEALPTPTDAGRTYAFHLRPGLHYSNGTLVQASDFRRAIERLFRVRSPGSGYYTSIAGAAGCVRRPSDCNLARGSSLTMPPGRLSFISQRPIRNSSTNSPRRTTQRLCRQEPPTATWACTRYRARVHTGLRAPTRRAFVSCAIPSSGSGHMPPNPTVIQT
jgi:YVTN family beta-propeller protein